jgi:hypothetical protein
LRCLLIPRLILACWEEQAAFAQAIFAKQKTRNVQREIHGRVTKARQGDNYGVPDFSCRCINDGALRANHNRLLEAARMVKANRDEEVINNAYIINATH